MSKSVTTRALAATIAAVVIAGGVVWTGTRGGGAPAAQPEVVVAERGEVAVTVGGVGHVDTLLGAALLAAPAPSGGPASGGAAGGSSSAAAGSAAGGSSPSSASTIFPRVAGHVTDVLVTSGQRVLAGQPLVVIEDDGTVAGNVLQARSDASTARLELAQKRVQDPARGAPPTAPELTSGSAAVLSARAKLARVLAPPLAADVAAARLDFRKALGDLDGVRAGSSQAVTAAQLAVATASQRLAALTGAPDRAELTAAQLDLAKATLEQETLRRPAEAPSAPAVRAADLAVAAAQQKLTDAEANGTPVEAAAARAELAKAQSDRDALSRPSVPPSAAAQAAAQLAVDVASSRLQNVVQPPAATVTAARRELATAQADLAGTISTRGTRGFAVAQAAIVAARRKLERLRHPTTEVVTTARGDVRKAQSDLAVLRQRGAPAGATDLALARLKVQVANERLALAEDQTRRLTVRANASGIVTSVLTVAGAATDPSAPLIRVEDLDHLVVALDLSEFDVARVRDGAPVRVIVDALGGKEFGGHVRDVAAGGVAVGGVVNFPVVISLNSHRRLRPGMNVSARVIVARRPDVVRIPAAAVSERRGRTTVAVQSRSGAVRQRVVELGLSGAELVEVRSGLRDGERVVMPTAAPEA